MRGGRWEPKFRLDIGDDAVAFNARVGVRGLKDFAVKSYDTDAGGRDGNPFGGHFLRILRLVLVSFLGFGGT